MWTAEAYRKGGRRDKALENDKPGGGIGPGGPGLVTGDWTHSGGPGDK